MNKQVVQFGRKDFLAGIAASAALWLAPRSAVAQGSAAPLTREQIAAILASPDRGAADLTNDRRRKPADMLAFIGIRPGITALDISAGGGYTTELLARAIGPTGKVYGQGRPANAPRPAPPAAPEGNSHPNVTQATPPPATQAPATPAPAATAPRTVTTILTDRAEKMRAAGIQAAPITAVQQPFEDPVPADMADGRFDLVTLIFNYHDLGHLGVDRAPMNRAVFRALKSGGMYVIADHAGRPGTGISESGTLHRIEEAFLRREVEAAGFRLAEEGSFLRNPNDPKDKNTPDPAQPKDEFVLKFVKP